MSISTLDLDFSSMINTAFTLIQSLWPIFVLPIGFGLGFGLLEKIMEQIRRATH